MELDLLLKSPPKIQGRVEISRSYTHKKNVGNYESRDFFCAQRVECAAEDADAIGELVYQWCKRSVLRSVAEYETEAQAQFTPERARRAS